MEVLLGLVLAAVTARWRPQLALRRWRESRRPVVLATSAGAASLQAGPAGTRVVAGLGAFDLKRLSMSPLTFVFILLAVGAWFGLSQEDAPDSQFNLLTGFATMWTGLLLIPVFELLASRDRRHELLDSLPTPRQRRTLGLALLAVVPAVLTYGGITLALMWTHHENLPLIRDPRWYELGFAAVIVLGGALLGIVAGRWVPAHLGMPVFFVGIVAGVIAIGTTDNFRLLSVVPEFGIYHDDPKAPLEMLAGSYGWHGIYLIGLCGLALAGATIFEHGRRRLPMLLGLAALAVTVTGAVAQQP
jgi:hypothetical protein